MVDITLIVGIILGIGFLITELFVLFKYKRTTDIFMTCVSIIIVCSYFELNISSFYSDFFNGKGMVYSYQKNLIDSSDRTPATEIFFWLYTSSVIVLIVLFFFYILNKNNGNNKDANIGSDLDSSNTTSVPKTK